MLAIDTIKVQVAYGDALVAAGLAATLRDQRDIELLSGPVDYGQGPVSVLVRPVDVIIADYENGLSILAQARGDFGSRQCGSHSVMIVSQRDTEFEIRHALEQGARGFLLLGCSVDELVSGVRSLRAGLRHIDGRAARRLADSVACEAITAREQAVLRLLVEGLGNKAIANRLGIAMGTVKSHLKSIFQKLNAGSRTEVATVAERRGLLTVGIAGSNRHEDSSPGSSSRSSGDVRALRARHSEYVFARHA